MGKVIDLAAKVPTLVFDGVLHWYVDYFDQDEDRCSFCCELIPDEDVPLIIFKSVGNDTWMARLHPDTCGARLLARGTFHVRALADSDHKH